MMVKWTEFRKSNTLIKENTLMCFDIEVSSFWCKDGQIYEWDKDKSDDWYNSAIKNALPYIWQFSIDDTIYYGREFKDLIPFVRMVCKRYKPKNKKSYCYLYVHNLSYEFQFMRQLADQLPITSVFARDTRKVMKFIWNDKIEVRCSFFLTQLSLAKWGEEIGINKKVGDLDYLKIRTPLTKLTPTEINYCEYDLRVMICGLKKYISEYGTIKKIPLTQTGTVRKLIKDMYKEDKTYKKQITRMQPRTVEEMLIFKSAFCGGDAHANYKKAAIIWDCASYDETSAYPSFQVRKTFPVSPFRRYYKKDIDYTKYCYIFGVQFKGLKSKTSISFLSKSRCSIAINGKYDNGRIISADTISLYCTEIDFEDIKKFYDYEEIEIIDTWRAKRGRLSKKYVQLVLDLFKFKSTLKGVDDELYMNSKKRLNSLYGVAVTSIINNIITYDSDWNVKKPTSEDIQKALDDIQEKWYKNVVAYVQGLYVTSWGRHELNNMIWEIGEDVVYYDTDSVKFINYEKHKHLFEEKNKQIIEEMEIAMQYYGIKGKPYIQQTPKGESILGTWDFEGEKLLKTLGAKKYITWDMKKGFEITVSGVPKKASKTIKSFKDFEDGFKFDAEVCQKGLSTYIDGTDGYIGLMPDGYYCEQKYGINIRNIGYTLGITDEYEDLIDYLSIKGHV